MQAGSAWDADDMGWTRALTLVLSHVLVWLEAVNRFPVLADDVLFDPLGTVDATQLRDKEGLARACHENKLRNKVRLARHFFPAFCSLISHF